MSNTTEIAQGKTRVLFGLDDSLIHLLGGEYEIYLSKPIGQVGIYIYIYIIIYYKYLLHESECDMVKYFMSRLIYFQE